MTALKTITAPPVRSTLLVDDLTVGYGQLTVARHLNFSVDAGEVLLLMGANGAGKTTTLLTIAGSLPALDGSVSWDGRPLVGPIHRRVSAGLSVVLDERGSISRLSAGDNLRLSGGSLSRALELFPELEPHLHRRAGLLSGGQQKMLSLAIALSRSPAVLLADELSLGLAPQVVVRLLKTVREAADSGAAVVMVEQHARRALEFADTVAVLTGGSIDLAGPVADVRAEVEEVLRMGYLKGSENPEPGAAK
ncbi:MAG: ABC transporter ATP-binding protein [Acidimicrobiales bacterium]